MALRGIDFDIKAFCNNLKATKPPYQCPIPNCGKVYKSYCGIQFHLYNYDHMNPENNTPTPKKPGRKKGKWHHRSTRKSPSPPPPEFLRIPPREQTLTYAESQRLVEVDLEGRIHRINIYEPLEICSQNEIENFDNTEKEEKIDKTPSKTAKYFETPKLKKETNEREKERHLPKLPEASFKVMDDYVKGPTAPTRPSSYYRFIEKSTDELDEEVEYDMDEEDYAWLELVNEKRKKDNHNTVSQEVFETLMDRFEKEAHFQSQTSGKDLSPHIDEDAVCSICNDGECQNSNVILFCDMCNLAVHQECYGVPYIPEGQWLCRRCLQSPSRAVDCCLCPNKGGAFKQTDDGRWAHVVCALWIPEVGFANTVFLEPIDSIANIPPARWKLTCYICKQRGTGACIQCHKTNCYTAFHVTCAQQAGLHMKIEPVREPLSSGGITVRKTAYCDVHTPEDSSSKILVSDDESEDKTASAKKAKAKSRIKMRKARKILAEKRNAVPVVSLPIIPQHRLSAISSKVSLAKKQLFIQRLIGYWTLKRQSRNGVPLLRRLQSNHMSRNKEETKNDNKSNALREQLKYWQRLRQDLEKARLLVELIRKREKLKREQIRLHHLATEYNLTPFLIFLRNTLDQIQEKDAGNIFAEPVDLSQVPDYLKVIDRPMDLSTMRQKLEGHQYRNVEEFEIDFEQILKNCMTYNAKDTVFYRAAVKMRDQGGAVIRAAKRMYESIGFDPDTGLHTKEVPTKISVEPVIIGDIDDLLPPEKREHMSLEEQLRILLDRMDYANSQKHGRRSKLAKQIKKEVIKVRRQLALQKGQSLSDFEDSKSELAGSSEVASTSSGSRSQSPEKNVRGISPQKAASHKLSSPVRTKGTPGRPPKVAPGGKTTKGTPGRPRGRPRLKSRSESESDPVGAAGGDKKSFEVSSSSTPNQGGCGDGSNNCTPSPSPAGVNRRTAVLFSKKAIRKGPVLHGGPTPPRKGRPPKHRPSQDQRDPASPQASTSAGPGSPRSPSMSARKRSASASQLDTNPSSPAKRGPSLSIDSPKPTASEHTPSRRESFFLYRTDSQVPSSSDSDTSSEIGSTEDSLSDSASQSSLSGDEGEKGQPRYVRRARTKRRRSWGSDDEDMIPLEPLDLVWAKCRGYPWYPALMINPKMPKTGYFHNGVPIPVPPDEVLEMRTRFEEPVFLVLFFDTKRTWQWLPRSKLEPLGVDSGLDKAKLNENKKPNVRAAVKKAYDKAVLHRCSVTGEPNPLSSDSSSDDNDD